MRSTFLAILFSAFVAEAVAADLPRHIVPDSEFTAKAVPFATLPDLLRRAIEAQGEFHLRSGQFPDTVHLYRFDLNGDGSPEYIVESPESYSMGAAHYIFERQRSGYGCIGYFQGRIRYLGSAYNGYRQIIASVHPGGSYVLRFRRGEYHSPYER